MRSASVSPLTSSTRGIVRRSRHTSNNRPQRLSWNHHTGVIHMPGKPRTLHLADTRVCRFHLYDKPTIQQLSRCSGTRTADRAFGRLSGVSLVPNYFAGDFQFSRSVIEELTASSVVTLIRNCPLTATSYCCRKAKLLIPRPTIRVWNSASGVPGSSDGPFTVIGTAIRVPSGAM